MSVLAFSLGDLELAAAGVAWARLGSDCGLRSASSFRATCHGGQLLSTLSTRIVNHNFYIMLQNESYEAKYANYTSLTHSPFCDSASVFHVNYESQPKARLKLSHANEVRLGGLGGSASKISLIRSD